ncbi:hypothetical protein [Paraburkholderia acidiphila]|uniref:Uncharacterized protein n=1 Tax=Paraburkholderia acidiphila TaxID=2571747 RepID=A0A7Z2GCM2_9BURK|nr:hypothetical protein [Paraburkholderia acidiphila]QGZ59351.1 hypothetical protein FAZ97_30570 [Paraburkholderia acidiphila]
MDPANGILAAWKDLEWLRFAVISFLALFLTGIVFYLATHPETTVGLQTIVTLLGTALGWLVGTKGSGTKTRT